MELLKFNSFTISSGTNDFWEVTDWQAGGVDWDARPIPNTKGVVHIAKGAWGSNDTAPTVTIQGTVWRSSVASLVSLRESIEQMRSDPRRSIGQAEFGLCNETTHIMNNCKLEEFIASEFFPGMDGGWLMAFQIKFVQVGA